MARYRGNGNAGKKPILLMAHLDVVPALKEDWSLDPFILTEKDGYFYGRGTTDIKSGDTALVSTFLRLKSEGFTPTRDLIIALTADEETTANSIKWLVTKKRNLIDAEFALNTDAGGGNYRSGKPVSYAIQASEKIYLTFIASIRNPGGHSSIPEPDNAIYKLAAALGRLESYRFAPKLNEVTRAYFRGQAQQASGQTAADMLDVSGSNPTPVVIDRLSKDPYYNALLHTTCVATMLKAGHAENALPQLAEATINCRIMPDQNPDSVDDILLQVLDNPDLELTRAGEPVLSPPSPLRDDILAAVRKAVDARYPGLVILPSMSTGATDGLFVRNAGIPTYGVSGLFEDMEDNRAHGKDERLGVDDFYADLDHWHSLLTTLAGD